ncbi:MAG: hypothetical protein EXR71_13635 [Myxococcales bacterium]|nr:hypothetical protein [Myxococcales bacterium]
MTRTLRRLAAVVALVATLFASLVTHVPGPRAFGDDADRAAVRAVWESAGAAARRLPDPPAWMDPLLSDKTVHVCLFALPAFGWALASGRRLRRRAPWLFLRLGVWATIDEGSQALLGRDGEWLDLVANLAGVCVGVALGWVVVTLISLHRRQPTPT